MRIPILLFLALTAAAGAFANDYDNAVREALAHGGGATADSLRFMAAQETLRADNVLDGPAVDFEFLSPTPGDDNRWSVTVSQSFDWPGAYGARRRMTQSQRDLSEAVLYSITLDKALAVKLLIIDIINARQRLALYEEIQHNLYRLDSLVERAYNLEAVNILDRRKMQLELLNSHRETTALLADLRQVEASLAAQGAVLPPACVSYPMQPMVQPSDNPEDFPEYRILQSQRQASAEASRVIHRESLPTFSLGYKHAYEDDTHFNGFTVSVGLPSWSTKARRRAAVLEAQATEFEGAVQLSAAMTERRSLYESARDMAENLHQYREIVGDNSYIDLLNQAYEGGEMTLADYLTEVNLFIRNRLDYLDQEYRLNLTLARLNKWRGIGF